MKRRTFLRNSSFSIAGLLLSQHFLSCSQQASSSMINYPSGITAILGGEELLLEGSGENWTAKELAVTLSSGEKGMSVRISSPTEALSEVVLHWKKEQSAAPAKIMNDHWERTYGDASWHDPKPDEILPWYFLAEENGKTIGFAVKTGATAFCHWSLDTEGLSLHLNTLSGGEGVLLGDRQLEAATILSIVSNEGENAFETGRRFAGMMCEQPRLPSRPVYGINDWYAAYGNNSDESVIAHTELLAPMAEGLDNRPFSLIDAGWYKYAKAHPGDGGWGDRMDQTNSKFKDMPALCDKIRKLGMRPGIWTRPLCGSEDDPQSLLMPIISGRDSSRPVLDPTIPENRERIRSYFKLYNEWGFEMVKFDFTSYDIFGKWGFQMFADKRMTEPGWHMQDRSKTNAEIVLDLYNDIRSAAADTYIISCNTFGQLAAGIFELNRIGDDTSGREWDRTRKMGVNTLAFRSFTHDKFYAVDADCVGLTTKIAWEKNKQWLDLLAGSGTPLFVSAEKEAVGREQADAIRKAFALASQQLPVGQPLDWQTNPWPEKWMLNGKEQNFSW